MMMMYTKLYLLLLMFSSPEETWNGQKHLVQWWGKTTYLFVMTEPRALQWLNYYETVIQYANQPTNQKSKPKVETYMKQKLTSHGSFLHSSVQNASLAYNMETGNYNRILLN